MSDALKVISGNITIMLAALLLTLPLGVYAGWGATYGEDITDEEWKYLPEYCKAMYWFVPPTVHVPQAEAELWRARLGEGSLHIHHYCHGLALMARANKLIHKTHEYERWMKLALGDILYTINKAPAKFPIRAEMHTNRARVALALKDPGLAWKEADAAIEVDPEYVLGYAVKIDAMLRLKKTAEAKKVLTAALEKFPDAKPLINRKKRLALEK